MYVIDPMMLLQTSCSTLIVNLYSLPTCCSILQTMFLCTGFLITGACGA